MDTQLKRGILEVCVLAELCRGQSYGYRIQKDLAQYVTLSESALYHILKRQEQAGQVQAASVEHEGRLRRMYSITEKGRRNSEICETSLPYSVRLRCDKNLSVCNRALRRKNQVKSSTEPRANGTYTVSLSLDDDMGKILAARFRKAPEKLYSEIIDLLLNRDEDDEDT